VPVHAVGKVADLFAGRGFDDCHRGVTNGEAIAQTTRLLERLDHGLVFANLIETDQVHGHRKDRDGFARALQAIDTAAGAWLERLREGDLLVLTSDHGVDMDAEHTDHTREHALLLAAGPGLAGRRHDGPLADVGATAVRWLTGDGPDGLPGAPFA
jgi:phosphopentomutase